MLWALDRFRQRTDQAGLGVISHDIHRGVNPLACSRHLPRGFEQEALDGSRNLVGFHLLDEVAMVLIRRESPLVAAIVMDVVESCLLLRPIVAPTSRPANTIGVGRLSTTSFAAQASALKLQV